MIKLRLKVVFNSDEEARLIYNSILPDNKSVLGKLDIVTEVRGNIVLVELTSMSPLTIKNTINEILMCMMTTLQVVSRIRSNYA